MIKKHFDGLQVMLASSKDVLEWSSGSVESPDTINYRTWKPKQKWLFCEAIFGPMKNFECSCGKYKWVRYKGIVCERCGVEVTTSRVRRERMGHIELASPVVHVWYVKATPSRIGLLLNLSINEIEKVLYYVKYLVTEINEEQKKNVIANLDKDYNNKINEIDKIYDGDRKQLLEDLKDKKEKTRNTHLDELRRVYTDNKSSLEKEYSRIKSILANLHVWSTILESDYRNIFYKYEWAFTFSSWSQAILALLKKVDVQEQIKLTIENFAVLKWEKRKKEFKRLKLLINLHISWVKPEWMVLSHLPVIPPDLRPVVQLEWWRFASSDVNLFYRRVLMRNLRLKKMIQVWMPDVVKKNEIRLLQESVNNLLVWEKWSAAKWWAWVKVFKSLTDMLSGKEWIFRKNLLWKRVDYSWRSVITVWPWLKLDECGLPLYLAVKMFTPFIIGKLIERKIVHTPKQAEKLIKDEDPIALKILEEVIENKYVLLNRAPTLHRLSIQAFKIKLMPWKTIRIHPLVTPAFNADFDGDQMAVHLPLSDESQREAKELIAADKNVLKPASWDPVITHSQDMVIGIYHLTDDSHATETVLWRFGSIDQVMKHFKSSELHIRDRVELRVWDHHLETTVWRVILNSILPDKIPFINEKVTKKWLKRILDSIFDLYGREKLVEVADALKDLWFQYATQSWVTMNVFDLHVPKEKPEILHTASENVTKVHNLWFSWHISDDEKHRLIISLWSDAKTEIEQLVRTGYEPWNDIFSLIDSGARGTRWQMTQMAGMKWLVSSPSWEIIELPIKSSLLEWFTPIEYFISAHGARKWKADTALRTAESWYLTRRLVDASQEVVIREDDCGTDEFIIISRDEAKARWEWFDELLFGRTAAQDIVDGDWVLLVQKNQIISKKLLDIIVDADVDYIKVRSPLTCKTVSGVCKKCYGMDLALREEVVLGAPIWVIASQSIWEPGTQLTMRTFHSWWVASAEWDMTQGIKRIEQLLEIRNPKKPSLLAPFDWHVVVTESPKKVEVAITSEPQPKRYVIKDGYSVDVNIGEHLEKWWVFASKWTSKLKVKEAGVILEVEKDFITLWVILTEKKRLPIGWVLKVKDWWQVFKWQVLSTWTIDIREYMKVLWALETQRYIVKEIKKVFTSQWQDVHDKYIEIIAKQLFSKVLIEDAWNSSFVPGTIVKYEEFVTVNQELLEQWKQPAVWERMVLWLTQVAKESDSWMSAASFQETIRVMVNASTRWAIDELKDLKANVILGRLLPIWDIYQDLYNQRKSGSVLDAIEAGSLQEAPKKEWLENLI